MHNASVLVSAANISFLDYYDYLEEWNGVAHGGTVTYVAMFIIGLVIVLGGFFNVSSVVILIRLRLWLQNEGYIQLLAILIGNIVIIVVVDFPQWLALFRHTYHVGLTVDAVCKVWRYLAHVAFSTGWYVVALLLGVYLRGCLARARGCQCCQRLAIKYCTLLGSKVTVGVISGVLAVMNLWQLWSVELIQISYHGGYVEKLCEVTYQWHPHFYIWEYVSLCIMWYLPVVVLIPVLLVMVLWTSQRTGAWFSFTQMREDGETDSADFARASGCIGLAVWLLQLPILIIYAFVALEYYHENLFVAYSVAHIMATTHIIVVPVLCLVLISRMRNEMKSAAAGKCCPCRADEEEDDLYGILQMDDVAQESSNQTV